MKKVISFSLWGDNYRYTGGALQNADLAKIIFPDWVCRFYVGRTTPSELVDLLRTYNNVEIIEVDKPCDWTGMFWRFLAAGDPTVDIMLSRDTDSRLSYREKFAIEEWIESDNLFHIIRDHPYHGIQILGGLWGAKKGLLTDIGNLIDNYQKNNHHGIDQNFLGEYIYPRVYQTATVHDEFFEKIPFPTKSEKRNEDHFVGQAYWGDGRIWDKREITISDYLEKDKIKLKIYEQFDKTDNRYTEPS